MNYIHLKSKRVYEVISEDVINATNKDDGIRMVLYKGMKRDGSGTGTFVREYNEFHEKFKLIVEPSEEDTELCPKCKSKLDKIKYGVKCGNSQCDYSWEVFK